MPPYFLWVSDTLSAHLVYAVYVNISLMVQVEYIKQSGNPCFPLFTAYFILTNGATILLKHQDRNLGFPLDSSFPNPLPTAVAHSTCRSSRSVFGGFVQISPSWLSLSRIKIIIFFTWISAIVSLFLYAYSFLF